MDECLLPHSVASSPAFRSRENVGHPIHFQAQGMGFSAQHSSSLSDLLPFSNLHWVSNKRTSWSLMVLMGQRITLAFVPLFAWSSFQILGTYWHSKCWFQHRISIPYPLCFPLLALAPRHLPTQNALFVIHPNLWVQRESQSGKIFFLSLPTQVHFFISNPWSVNAAEQLCILSLFLMFLFDIYKTWTSLEYDLHPQMS